MSATGHVQMFCRASSHTLSAPVRKPTISIQSGVKSSQCSGPRYDEPVDDGQFQQIAKTVADPSRLAALQMIARGEEVSCSAVRDYLELTPATISHHVKELVSAGLDHYRREAKFAYLSLNRTVWDAYLRELNRRIPKI